MILFILMGLCLLSAACLVAVGGTAIRQKTLDRRDPSIVSWPDAAVVVPAAGATATLPDALESLLSQDYPSYRLVFVTRDAEDPATDIIREVVGDHPGARHLLGGNASVCGQKNHNLLRGVAALGDRPEILVFCDSTRVAPPNWLRSLVGPVVQREVEVTSGYHHVIPRDNRLSTQGHAFSVLLLSLTKGIPFLNQPWGGGTVVRRETFEGLGVEKIWSRNIVDDVSLAALLKRGRIKVGLSAGAFMTTPLKGETMRSWIHWLVRQWFYLKVCMPGSWLAAGLYCYLFAAMLILAAIGVVGGIPGWVSGLQTLTSLCFLGLFAGLALVLRILHPDPSPPLRWLISAFLTLPVAAWAHVLTIFTMEITWWDIRYRVRRKGEVEGMDEAI